eukprot:m.198010 g.198010  ORF g.198010 m.198010 type:complete len:293 (+) comp10651_c0_seq3:2-880(+)
MEAATFKRIHPAEYIARFLAKGLRPDGRAVGGFRKTSISTGSIDNALGSATVRLGGTSVVCGIKAEFANPPAEVGNLAASSAGWFVPNVTMSPMCHPAIRPGPAPAQAQALSQFLNQTFKHPSVFDLSQLNIVPGKLSWVLYADIVCLNADGNLVDACVLALAGALRDFRLPTLEHAPGDDSLPVIVGDRSTWAPLNLERIPIAATFGLFDGEHLVADPSSEEEELVGTTQTIVMSTDGLMLSIQKPAPGFLSNSAADCGAPMSPEQFRTCATRARKRVEDLARLLDSTLTQ